MRIAAISVAPVFPDQVIGGSQKILADLAVGLKSRGHDIQIWCTGTEAHSGDFDLLGVSVHPDLRLSGSFPATHQVSPTALARTAEVLKEAADWADRVYLHADAVYLRHALEGTQIIRSIHDYVYEEALVSTLSLPADTTVVPSEYTKRCIEATVALSGRTTIEPVVVVPNGVSVSETPVNPWLPDGVDAREDSDFILLFPHRPEPTKGVHEAISLAVRLQATHDHLNVRLLMPTYSSDSNFDEAAGTSDELTKLINELGATDLVELHDWLSPEQMPGYYSAGDVTLCIGSFIEAFGLVPVESVAAGTPVVCASVGAFRQFQDVEGITVVPYGDVAAAMEATVAAEALSNRHLETGKEKIKARYSHDEMISSFESVITRTLGGTRNVIKLDNDRLELVPWCAVVGKRIYNDYDSSFHDFPKLIPALEATGGYVSADPLLMSASLDAEVRFAVEQGILMPEFAIE